MVKTSILISLFTITLINLGCEMGAQATSKEIIERDILEYMNTKYDEDFVVKSIRWESNVASKTMDKHFIKLATQELPDEVFDAKVSYENSDKTFDLLFEYYPRILMGKAANKASMTIIDKYLKDYTSKTVMINTYKLEADVYPNDNYSYEEIVAQSADKWQTNLNIDAQFAELGENTINDLFFELVEDHKKRNHDLLGIHLKAKQESGTIKNYVLKLNMIQATDLASDKEKILAKIMSF